MKKLLYAALGCAVILAGLQASESLQAGSSGETEKWRIVNYWSEWCAPCRDEIPILNELNDQLAQAGSNVTIVGVNFEDNPREETLEIARRMGISFPILTRDAVKQLQLKAPAVLPTTYILSPDDRVVARLAGAQSRESLLTQLEQLQLVEPPPAKITMIDTPAGSNSSLSRVVSDSQDRLYLSWVTQQGETSVLSYARLEHDLWQTPQMVAQGEGWYVNWADFPSLVVNEESMAAHWLRKSAAGPYDYDVRASFYQPDLRQWSEPITVHRDGVSAEHGFVSMVPMSDGRTFMSWLDGRNTRAKSAESEAVGGHEAHQTRGAMTVRAAIFDRHGERLEVWELDRRVCDCCQTSVALAASGPVVVYRNRSEEEIRDTYITRLIDGRWSDPMTVHPDGWEIAGCPVNGPAVVARDQFVAVAWFTAVNDIPEVKLALSHDSGATFSAPIIVASENTLGRIGSSLLASGDIAVSWIDAEGDMARVMLARYSAAGELMDRVEVAQTDASRRSGFPVISSAGNGVYVTWTDISGESQVRLARVQF